ncbi:MAG: T9SS type A sorting domain-containing protein, partial [Bacteroidales bacterium]|nr:T9SS type A sorting domain-containing protein [Bacteroidales bacterium]
YVTGSGTYEDGTEVIITANPYQGYKFFLWDDGYRENVFERYNNESSRTITVTSDKTYTATFVRDEGTERENVLIELFSYQSDSYYGPVAAKILDDMEASDTMNIIVINHQFNSRDTYYYAESDNRFMETKEDVFGESAEYGGSPTVFFDGYLFAAGARSNQMSQWQNLYTYFYSNVKNVKSLYNLTADITPNEENDRMFTLNVTAEKLSDYYDGDQIVIIAALTEDIDYDWGEAGKMNNIVRLMYPNSEGTEVTFDDSNLFSTEFSINISDEYDITKCKLVVWIENHTQGRIMQSKRFNKLYRDTFEIAALANNEDYGTVSGGGTYNDGDTVTLMAMPYDGYCFISWEDENADNPRTITVTSDSTFIANFSGPILFTIDTVVNNFVTVGDHTFYSTGNYAFSIPSETGCDTIYDINLRVLAEPVYDIGPNPTEKILNITSDSFISYVEFYSPTGQLVMRKEVNGYEAEFDMEGLVDGVYILRIYGEESSLPAVSKVVKE